MLLLLQSCKNIPSQYVYPYERRGPLLGVRKQESCIEGLEIVWWLRYACDSQSPWAERTAGCHSVVLPRVIFRAMVSCDSEMILAEWLITVFALQRKEIDEKALVVSTFLPHWEERRVVLLPCSRWWWGHKYNASGMHLISTNGSSFYNEVDPRTPRIGVLVERPDAAIVVQALIIISPMTGVFGD